MGASLAHDLGLLVGYGAALAAWLGLARLQPGLWPPPAPPGFARPWRELAWVLGGLAICVLLAQLHARGFMLVLPGIMGAIAAAVEQVIVFAPVLAIPHLRGQDADSAWLPRDRVWLRIAVGLVLSELALLGHAGPGGLDAWLAVSRDVYHPYNLPYLIQVFCQDVVVAILFIRLRAVMGTGWTIALIAAGFAAARLPELAAAGLGAEEAIGLLLDAALGAGVLGVLQRSADVWWFCWVHFALQMV